MSSKLPPFVFSRRFPIWVSLNSRFSSAPCPAAAHVRAPPVPDRNPRSPPSEFESAVRFLGGKLHPDKLVRVLDSIPNPDSAVGIFRWASSQRNFPQTPEAYALVALKLGMVGNLPEMEVFLKEMVKAEHPDVEGAMAFVIGSFCRNCRPREAFRAFEIASSVSCWPSISTCNALLGALIAERCDFESILYVYKEIVKGGMVPIVVTLNYLLEALFESGSVDSAMDQFRKMSRKGCAPNSRTFEILITNLCVKDRVDDSVKVLGEMFELGCRPDCDFYQRIIPLFCRFNRLAEGMKLFQMMRATDVLPDLCIYNALLWCLCENLQLDNAVQLLEEMSESGLTPVVGVYVGVVNGYYKLGKFGVARNFLDKNCIFEIEAFNALLQGYCAVGRFCEASGFLEKMLEKEVSDNLSWNILIRALCERRNIRKAFEVLSRMIVSSYMPDQATYSAVITGHCKMGMYENAFECFRQVRANDWSLDLESYSELIRTLCHAKKIQSAVQIFYYISGKGCILPTSSLNLLIHGICQMGKVNEAIKLRSLSFCNGTSSSPGTFNTIMLRLSELKKAKYVLVLLSQMFVEDTTLDAETYRLLIRCSCVENMTRDAALLFDWMVDHGFVPDSESIDMLLSCMAKDSQMHMVTHSLHKVVDKDDELLSSTTYNMIIYALLKEGHKHEACKFLDQMLEKGWLPDADAHGLLVGNITREGGNGQIEAFEGTGKDRVSKILAEGLVITNEHIVEE